MKTDQAKLIDQIIRKILGYSPEYGFFDHDNDPAGWHQFVEDSFCRAGEIDGHQYTADVNKRLSSTAMLQTLEEIYKRLQALKQEIDGSGSSTVD